MKTALLTVCPGRDVPLARWHGTNVPCSVHGFAHAIGADIWEGARLSPEVFEALPGYDAVVLNTNTEMIYAAPEIAARLHGTGTRLALLQEGDARTWDGYEDEKFVAWVRAAALSDVLLIYNAQHAREWEALTGTPARQVYLPRPDDAAKHAIHWMEREHAAFTGSGVTRGRGGVLSLAVARAVVGDGVVYTRRSHYNDFDVCPASETIAAMHGAQVTKWSCRPDFLRLLATCRLAVNLDPIHSYGRFAADCAELGVPCLGFESHMMQAHLWPGLTIPSEADPMDFMTPATRAFLDPLAAAEHAGIASERAKAADVPRVLEIFEAAMRGVT